MNIGDRVRYIGHNKKCKEDCLLSVFEHLVGVTGTLKRSLDHMNSDRVQFDSGQNYRISHIHLELLQETTETEDDLKNAVAYDPSILKKFGY